MPLTSMERVLKAIKFEPVDRMPILPFGDQFAIKQAGYLFRDAVYSPAKWAEGYARTRERFGLDCVFDQCCSEGNADLGLPKNAYQPEDDMSYYPQPYFIQEPEDIKRVKPPEDPWDNQMMRRTLLTVQKLREYVGPDVPIVSTVTGPFRMAGVLRGFDVLAIDTVDRPQWVHDLLETITQGAIRLGKALVDAGADFTISFDPTTSASFVSVKTYLEFGYPYVKKMWQGIRAAGAKGIFFHFCGETMDRIHISAGDCDLLAPDIVDLGAVYEKIGRTGALLGANIPITNVLLKGTPTEVERCTIQTILKTEGYVSQSGSCHIPRHTPATNFDTWMKASRDYGTHPIDLDALRKRLEQLPPLACDERLRGFN